MDTDYRLKYLKESRNYNRRMAISDAILCVLDFLCAILYGFKAVVAIMAGTTCWGWIVLGIVWIGLGIGNTIFTRLYVKEWREAEEKIKEIENE
jgi:F0F1-type ATP synthase assembly protein I